MSHPDTPIKEIDPELFTTVFGPGSAYGVGIDHSGNETLIVPIGTQSHPVDEVYPSAGSLLYVKATAYLAKCDENGDKWCCRNGVCIWCGTC